MKPCRQWYLKSFLPFWQTWLHLGDKKTLIDHLKWIPGTTWCLRDISSFPIPQGDALGDHLDGTT
jgi:hypothetical protein